MTKLRSFRKLAFYPTNEFEMKNCRKVVVEDPSALKTIDLDSLCLLLEGEAMDSMRRFLKLSKMRYFISRESLSPSSALVGDVTQCRNCSSARVELVRQEGN